MGASASANGADPKDDRAPRPSATEEERAFDETDIIEALAAGLDLSLREAEEYWRLHDTILEPAGALSSFAGIVGLWLETDPVRVQLGVSSRDQTHVLQDEEVRDLLSEVEGQTELEIVEFGYDATEFWETLEAVDGLLRDGALGKIVSVTGSPKRGGIRVFVDGELAGEGLDIIRSRVPQLVSLGITIDIEEDYQTSSTVVVEPSAQDYGACVSSFSIIAVENNRTGVTTAGHCGNGGLTIDGVAFGGALDERFVTATGFDVQHHNVGTSSHSVSNRVTSGWPIVGTLGPIVGMAVCTYGTHSSPNFICGTVDHYDAARDSYGSDIDCSPGDSGGPWFTTRGADAFALGITSYSTHPTSGQTPGNRDDPDETCQFARADQNFVATDAVAREGLGTNFRASGRFVPVIPTRIESGTGVNGAKNFTVPSNVGGVATAGAGAAILNIATYGSTADGYFHAYQRGGSSGSLAGRFEGGETNSQQLVVELNDSRQYTIKTSRFVNVIVDMVGFVVDGSGTSPLISSSATTSYTPFASPVRRTPTGISLAANASTTIDLPGSSSRDGALLTVTVSNPSANGHLKVYGNHRSEPSTSSLNFAAGEPTSNTIFTEVDNSGLIRIKNSNHGPVTIYVDHNGDFFRGSTATFAGRADTVVPDYIRSFTATSSPQYVQVTDDGVSGKINDRGVPQGVNKSALLVVQVYNPSSNGWISFWRNGSWPGTTTINFRAGETTTTTAFVPLNVADGTVRVRSSSGSSFSVSVRAVGYVYN